MKRLIFLLLLPFTIVVYGQQKNRAALTTQANAIKNATSSNSVTQIVVGNMFLDIIKNTQNLIESSTTTGTDTYAVTVSPSVTAYVTNSAYLVTFGNASVGSTLTLSINSLTPLSIINEDGSPCTSIPINVTKLLVFNGSALQIVGGSATGAGGTGTVTNVNASVPSFLTVSGVPITTSGTITIGLNSTSQNFVLAGPTSGSGAPSMRALVAGDLPSLSGVYQPLDADLTTISSLTPSNDDVLQRKSGAWTNRTMAQLSADLAISSAYWPLAGSATGTGNVTVSGLSNTASILWQNLNMFGADTMKVYSFNEVKIKAPKITFPDALPNNDTIVHLLGITNTGRQVITRRVSSITGAGTVTSVGLSLPSIFSVSGSPVTTSGTLTGTLANQTANTVFSGPSTGSPAAPTFRALTATDIPALPYWLNGGTTTLLANSIIDGDGLSYGVTFQNLSDFSVGTSGGNIDLSTDAGITASFNTLSLNSALGPAFVANGTDTEISAGGSAIIIVEPNNLTINTGPSGGGTGALGDSWYRESTGIFTRLPGNTTTTRKFWTQTGNGTISAAPVLNALVSADIPNNAANTTGSAATLTTSRTIGTITGDGTSAGSAFNGSANNTNSFTLATVNSDVGSFGSSTSIPSFTVNAKGLITAASVNVVIAPAGTLTGTTLNSTVVASSLTSLGTIATGVWNGTRLTNAYTPQGSGLSVWGVTGSSTADQASIVGTADQVLRINGAGTANSFGSIDLSKTATVGSSILPVANGGTGSATVPYWLLTGTSTIVTPTITGKPTWNQASESSTNTFQTFTQAAHTGGSPVGLLFTGGAHTTLSTTVEATDININLARTVQFATGTLATQRAFRIQAPTYGFVGASNLTKASTLSISDGPSAGTNATIAQAYALDIEAGKMKVGNFSPPATTLTASIQTSGEVRATGGFNLRNVTTNDNAKIGFFINGSSDVDIYSNASPTLLIKNIGSSSTGGSYVQASGTLSPSAGTAAATRAFLSSVAWQASGGTNNFSAFEASGIVNTSGSWTGDIRGFYYNPSLNGVTGVTNNFALLATSGKVLINGTTITASTEVDIRGTGTTSSTINTRFANSSNTLLSQLTDDGTWTHSGNFVLGSIGNKLSIKEGSGGFLGPTTLVAGTKSITVTGVTTSTRCFLTRVTPGNTTLTTGYDCSCTANTVTIQADVAAGTINTADTSTFNYVLIEPAP